MSRKRVGAGTAKAEEASAAMRRASAVVKAGPERRARTPTGGRPGLDGSRGTEERHATRGGGRLQRDLRAGSPPAPGPWGARKMLLAKHRGVQCAPSPPPGG